MMTPDRNKWKPILNEAGEQVGWDTGDDGIKFSTPERFLQVEGMMALALEAKKQREKVAKLGRRKKGKVAPKQPRGRK